MCEDLLQQNESLKQEMVATKALVEGVMEEGLKEEEEEEQDGEVDEVVAEEKEETAAPLSAQVQRMVSHLQLQLQRTNEQLQSKNELAHQQSDTLGEFYTQLEQVMSQLEQERKSKDVIQQQFQAMKQENDKLEQEKVDKTTHTDTHTHTHTQEKERPFIVWDLLTRAQKSQQNLVGEIESLRAQVSSWRAISLRTLPSLPLRSGVLVVVPFLHPIGKRKCRPNLSLDGRQTDSGAYHW